MISYIGMVLIILGWGIQLVSKEQKVKPSFVLVYTLGVVLLVVDLFRNDNTILGILNSVSALTALLVFLKVRK